jgi:hypothetical protein
LLRIILTLNHKEKAMNGTKKLGASLVVLLGSLAMGLAPAAQATSAPPSVYPPQAHPFGHTYSQWGVRWVQWLMAIPKSKSPDLDTTGAFCAEDQSGPVWYLPSDSNGGTIVRTCTIPTGKAVLIEVAIMWCDTAEGNGNTFAKLSSCAKGYADGTTKADFTLDGVHLTNVLTRYRFATSLFTLKYPADSLLQASGPGVTKAVANGLFVILAPLAPGQHTVEAQGVNASIHWAGDVTYHLTVRG